MNFLIPISVDRRTMNDAIEILTMVMSSGFVSFLLFLEDIFQNASVALFDAVSLRCSFVRSLNAVALYVDQHSTVFAHLPEFGKKEKKN